VDVVAFCAELSPRSAEIMPPYRRTVARIDAVMEMKKVQPNAFQ